MQTVEAEITKTAALTSKQWTPTPTASSVANANKTTRALKGANELRGALLDSIAHDLRSPLTAIRAVSEILRTQSAMTKQEQEEMFAIVEQECFRLDRMISGKRRPFIGVTDTFEVTGRGETDHEHSNDHGE